jgi:hypothetical protein
MRTYLLLTGSILFSFGQLRAQRACLSADYLKNQLQVDPSLAGEMSRIENFIQNHIAASANSRIEGVTIKIPVVVHILYHVPGENISDETVFSQIDMLNKCFRRTHPDSARTPAVFKPIAADCEIEFQLATSDPLRRRTTGISHKYTPLTYWQADDLMKSSAQMGDDPWDAKSYLNIWVCNMRKVAGYASLPGGPAAKDGVVIDFNVFGTNTKPGYEMGKTAVHEVGHWLGLRHIWGDAECGDDLVADTPPQSDYSIGCPTGIHTSCNNGPNGDMYSNYMDYTSDACVNLFTEGQKTRMRAYFAAGAARNSLLTSTGLSAPLIEEAPLPDEAPRWLAPRIYPNPAGNELVLDVAYDIRWLGKLMIVVNATGQRIMQFTINSKIQKINIAQLRPGLYFISSKKEDGSYIKQKFIKM